MSEQGRLWLLMGTDDSRLPLSPLVSPMSDFLLLIMAVMPAREGHDRGCGI